MIYIDRDRVDENGVPIRPNDAWFQAAEEATEVALQENGDHDADRDIFAHVEVRKALEKLFYDKCAYCECKIIAGWDWNVEHFRPKGRVAEREDHVGYYWLAYHWDNLYLSCTHCNQRRKDRPRWADPEELPAAGKMDQFPLADEDTRAMSPDDDIYAEHTLLIDPCYDDPESYLMYDPFGQVFPLKDDPYGERTIDVLHLERRRLRDPRRKTVQEVILRLKLIA